jgi:SAM-dependent methyltransferase
MMSQLVRYAPVIPLIEEERPRLILEVGPGSEGLGKFFARRFVGAETDFSDYTGAARRPSARMLAVRADGAALPFGADAFDLVLMIDVLEHVAPGARSGIVRECVRVARGTVAIGFPAGVLAEAHDREHDHWLRARGLPRPGWLAEHLAHPFPSASEVAPALAGGRWAVLDNAWLPVHRVVMRWEARARGARYSALLADLLAPTAWDWHGHRAPTNALRAIARPLRRLLRLLDRRPAYRTVIVVQKGRAREARPC